MEPYAVVETGGKQYRVKANDTLQVERVDADPGATVEMESVLAVSDGETLQVGKPDIEGCKVACTVVDHIRGDKIISFKKKRRKGYSRKKGHRQGLTVLKVISVEPPSADG